MNKDTYSVFIDTRNQTDDPSNFVVRLPDYFIRTSIKNDLNNNYQWYISIRNFSMFNSFSNVSKDINDVIVLYEEISAGSITVDPQSLDDLNPSLFNKTIYRIREGNPNTEHLKDVFNGLFQTKNITIEFDSYDSTFKIKTTTTSTVKRYLCFETSSVLFGFDKDTLYSVYENNSTHSSIKPCNVQGDYSLNFLIDQRSDFKLKNVNYTNIYYDNFNDSNIFFNIPINVLPYELIYYNRSSLDDMIAIEPYRRTINEFRINIRNQDNTEIEGLTDWQMTIDFIKVKKNNELKVLVDYVKLIYMWIGSYFNRSIK